MLDVHVPHPTHTWRDFFIHIATIVVGLIIAVGLEQGVEALHHHRQRRELRDALRLDAEIAVQQTDDVHTWVQQRVDFLSLRIDQVREALATGHPLAPPPPPPKATFTEPDDPAWKAARSADLGELLTQEEIKAYNDVDFDLVAAERLRALMNETAIRATQFDYKFSHTGKSDPDFSTASAQDLREYLDLLAAAKGGARAYNAGCRSIHGAESAILRGEVTLQAVQTAEQKPW